MAGWATWRLTPHGSGVTGPMCARAALRRGFSLGLQLTDRVKDAFSAATATLLLAQSYGGPAFAIVQATGPGTITVTATSPGLTAGTAMIEAADGSFVPCGGTCD